jgi:NTP pyrophosphatase (non-canonical NTP hydrolase)
MKKIIEDNYQSIVDRGLITNSTSQSEFFNKIKEEFNEMVEAKTWEDFKFELADVILSCLNLAKHYKIDIEKYLNEKIEINKQRAKDGK